MWRRNITVMFSTFLFGWLASAVNSIKFYFGLLALSRHTKGIILFSEKTTVSRRVNMFHLDKKSILLSNSDFFLRSVFNLSGLRSRCMHYLAPTYGSVLWGNNYEDHCLSCLSYNTKFPEKIWGDSVQQLLMLQLEWYSCINKEESYEKPTDGVLFVYYFSKY